MGYDPIKTVEKFLKAFGFALLGVIAGAVSAFLLDVPAITKLLTESGVPGFIVAALVPLVTALGHAFANWNKHGSS